MTIWVRHWLKHAEAAVRNLTTHPEVREGAFAGVGLHVVLEDVPAEIERLRALVRAAEAIGVPVLPGFRLMEGLPFAGWCDRARWERNARWVRELAPNSAIALDAEAYGVKAGPRAPSAEGLASIGKTETDLRDATAPFFSALFSHGAAPCVYPVSVDDAFTTLTAEFDAERSGVELWTEDHYRLPEIARRSPSDADTISLKLARLRTMFARKFPGVAVRHGTDDTLLRAWGGLMRARAIDYGPLDPWLFDRRRVDNLSVGTPAWVSGTSLSSTNDVTHAWVGPIVQGSTGSPGGLPFAIRVPLTLAASRALPEAGDFAVAIEAVLPKTGDGPIVGESQVNSESWQVVLRGDEIALEVRHQANPGPSISRTTIGKATRGIAQRIVLSRAGDAWLWRGGQTTLRASLPCSGHLWLGGGTTLDGSRTQLVLPGLAVLGAEVWHRALSPAEIEAVTAAPYPR